jgi:putative spermidine/putrescine transport system permease protein
MNQSNVASESTRTRKRVVSKGRYKFPFALLPFFIFVTFFLAWPISTVVIESFKSNSNKWTLSNYGPLFHGIYLHAFETSIRIGLITALLGVIIGGLFAFVIESYAGPRITSILDSVAAVFANSGGVPLAFTFLASFGANAGLIKLLKSWGWDLYSSGFSIFSFTGICLVYIFFQAPLMVLIFKPALKGLRKEWKEASTSLGGSSWTYLRRIALPILFPSFVGSFLLLFAGGFSAYATARALTVGNIPLIPLIIGNLVDGNVIADKTHLGASLAIGAILIALIAMTGYIWAQRKSTQWRR